MTDRVTRIAIVGSTVWSGAMARAIAQSGVAVTYIQTGLGSGMGMGLARRDSLARLPLDLKRKLHHATSLTHRTVLDYECIDGTITSARLQDAATQILIVDRLVLINALVADAGIETHNARQVQNSREDAALHLRIGRDRELTVDYLVLTGTSDAASATQVTAGLDPEELDLITEVGWPDHGTGHTSWLRASGPGVLNGSAVVLSSPSGVFVTLRNAMRDINRAGVETHEVIQSMIDHPAFGDIIPTTQPGYTANRTIPPKPTLSELRFRELVLDLSSVSGFMDPCELDLDLAIGTRLGHQLAAIITAYRKSGARLSSLSRELNAVVRTNQTVSSIMATQFPGISARHTDALFTDLIQSHP